MATTDISSLANVEHYTISGNLNSTMLQNFLMGIYTIVFGGTIYIYLSRKPMNRNNLLVLAIISVLYILSFLDFAVQWYFLNWTLIVNGATRDTVFAASLRGPTWLNPLLALLDGFELVISDGLLIWRCYHVWGKSIKVITIPSLLLVVQFGLSVTGIALNLARPQFTIDANADLENHLATALVFMSLGTTVSATFLIGYKITTASGNILRSKRRYNQIVATIVESSAIYSLVLLFTAMVVVVPAFYDVQSPSMEVRYYVQATLSIVSGMAPTVMVARLALANTNNAVSSGIITHISGINFISDQNSGSGDNENASGMVGPKPTSLHLGDLVTREQTPVRALTKESNIESMIGQSPV